MAQRSKTQDEAVLEALVRGARLTAIVALEAFGCFRLAAVVHRLRNAGWRIISDQVSYQKDGQYKRYVAYRLDAKQNAAMIKRYNVLMNKPTPTGVKIQWNNRKTT